MNYFENECNLKGIYFYTGRVGDNNKQDSFLQKLGRFGYVVKSKEVKQIRLENNAFEWKGNLDVELALDSFRLRSGFDTILLFSGDSDFAYLLDLLRKDNKRVIVFSTRGHVSKELITRAKYIDLKKLRVYIELKIKEPQSGS